jgi:hypothetical protein
LTHASQICPFLELSISRQPLSQEAQTGFEPVNQGVADPRLTTWLLRLIHIYILHIVK